MCCCRTTRMRCASDNANDCRMPAAPTESKVGERIDKETIAEDIGNGLWRKYGREAVTDYCEEDVRKSVLLLIEQLRGRRHLPAVNVEHVLHWSNYSAKSVA